MSKLHELLAVEGNLANQSQKCTVELLNTLDKKRHHFAEKRITFTASTEGAQAVTEEQSDIQTTVTKELDWLSGILTKAIDASHQIDVANTLAKANVVTEDGQTLLKDVPATSLLALEKTITGIRALVAAVPTLDPAKGFEPDTSRGKGYFRARDVRKARTKKTPRVITKAPPTKEHPAQVELIYEDLPVGVILEQEWSSLITPATKSDLLDRCDILLRAVKTARSKANDIDVNVREDRVGKTLLDYVFQPLRAD